MNASAATVPALRPIRRQEYDRMVAAGLFDGENVELIRGAIVTTSPSGPDHSFAVQELTALFVHAFAGRAVVQIRSPFAASDDSEPEPDVAVVPPGDYRKAHPAKPISPAARTRA